MSDIDYKKVYRLFFHPGEVVEIRAMGITGKDPAWKNEYARKNSIIYGYFDNEDDFEKAARSLDSFEAQAIYFTANPPKKACLARSPNALEVYNSSGSKQTSEADVACIRWFLVDIDPKGDDRVSGTSSTDEEKNHGHNAGQAIISWLQTEFGFCQHIGAMSGNGYHIWYRLDDLEPSDALNKSNGTLHNALRAIRMKFPQEQYKVDIDEGVYKVAQLGKLYGTITRKGKHTEDRPHRRSHLFNTAPDCLDNVPILDLKKLKKLANYYEKEVAARSASEPAPSLPATTTKMPSDSLGPVDIEKYLEYYNWNLHATEKTSNGTKYQLGVCPFNENHKKDAVIFVYDTGIITFNCFHASCKGYKWSDVKQIISGSDKLTQFREGYDPNWKPKAKKKRTSTPANILSEYATDLSQLNVINNLEEYQSHVVLPPNDIDPDSFFKVNPRTGRKEFMQSWAASYIATYLAPIAWTDGVFYKYQDGVWAPFEEAKFVSILDAALGDSMKGNYIDTLKKVFIGKIRRSESDWRHRDDLINVKNGMVDLSTDHLNLIDHNSIYDSRIQLNVSYDHDAEFPRWHRFLNEVFPEEDGEGDAKRTILQEFMAYCVMPTCKYEKCLFCYGHGANGKSTVLDTLAWIVGIKNVCHISIDQLSHRFNVPSLQHKLINMATEVNSKEQVGTDVLKSAVSGEIISGERKHGDRMEFINMAKFIFAMNEHPGITDRTFGLSRRILILEFKQKFDGKNQELDLKRYFIDNELDGIFMWMLHGINRLRNNNGFTLTEHLDDARDRFMRSINIVLLFVDEKCRLDNVNENCYIECSKLHLEFINWCKLSNHRGWGKNKFYDQIEINITGVKRIRKSMPGGQRIWCFQGIDIIQSTLYA